jgi:hypothetical protein
LSGFVAAAKVLAETFQLINADPTLAQDAATKIMRYCIKLK